MWWIGAVATILLGLGVIQWGRRRNAMQKALIARCLACDAEQSASEYCSACELFDREIRQSPLSPVLIDISIAIDALITLHDRLLGFDVGMVANQDPATVASELRSLEQHAIQALQDHPDLIRLLPDLELGGLRHSDVFKWTSSQPESVFSAIQLLKNERTKHVETPKAGSIPTRQPEPSVKR